MRFEPTTVLDRTLAALADPTRRSIVDLLVHRPQRAGELATALSMSAPAMSRHLRVLRSNGLVAEEHQGDDARVRTYRLERERFDALRKWLADVASVWSAELEAPERPHAERRGGVRSPPRPVRRKR